MKMESKEQGKSWKNHNSNNSNNSIFKIITDTQKFNWHIANNAGLEAHNQINEENRNNNNNDLVSLP